MKATLWRSNDNKRRTPKYRRDKRVHVPPCSPQIPRGMGWTSILIKIQLDATVCKYLFTAQSLYMCRVSPHPPSGVLLNLFRICGGQRGTWTGFSPSSPDFSFWLSFHHSQLLLTSNWWSLVTLEPRGRSCGARMNVKEMRLFCFCRTQSTSKMLVYVLDYVVLQWVFVATILSKAKYAYL